MSLSPYLLVFTVLAAVGSGLVAGLLFAFSTAVMKSLARLPAEHGMRAMQHINVVILNPLFLGAFMGTALLSALLAAGALLVWTAPVSLWLLMGAAAYLVGTFGVTMAVNVPLNNRLAATDADASDADRIWTDYVEKWLRWNHLRTLLGTVASLSFTLAVSYLRG
jgi:uncharacterized membrane protein